jgi:predicted nucleic acid-binding protein
LLVPEVVLSEVAYLVGARVGAAAETKLAAALRERELQAVATVPDDWRRVAELVDRYLDLPLGLVDATVVAIAERLSVSRLATLDRRHFSVVRPRHVEGFELVP